MSGEALGRGLPSGPTREHVAALRAAGLDDAAVLDVINSGSFFDWANRLMLSLGADVELAAAPPFSERRGPRGGRGAWDLPPEVTAVAAPGERLGAAKPHARGFGRHIVEVAQVGSELVRLLGMGELHDAALGDVDAPVEGVAVTVEPSPTKTWNGPGRRVTRRPGPFGMCSANVAPERSGLAAAGLDEALEALHITLRAGLDQAQLVAERLDESLGGGHHLQRDTRVGVV
jgi:hypothetical protein